MHQNTERRETMSHILSYNIPRLDSNVGAVVSLFKSHFFLPPLGTHTAQVLITCLSNRDNRIVERDRDTQTICYLCKAFIRRVKEELMGETRYTDNEKIEKSDGHGRCRKNGKKKLF